MIRAYNITEELKYKLIGSEYFQLPPSCNLAIIEVGLIKFRLIFSNNGVAFSLSAKKSSNNQFLDFYFYNWNSEIMTDLKKPITFTFQGKKYNLNVSTKINFNNNIRTVNYTLWENL
ncbi:MAG: hypothetical protein SFY56_14200 [Bacteroidota bacterium]|nr:hypothetical protein [Bacteroidota bacterium]